MPTIHYKHLHQHQQSFVTLNSPSPFDAAPQTRCIPQITIYPELEAEEPRAFHKRRQLAEILIYLFVDLFIFLSAAMRNPIYTSCSHLPAFTWSSAPVQSIYASSLHCMLLCSLQSLPTLCLLYSRLHLIYPHLLLLN